MLFRNFIFVVAAAGCAGLGLVSAAVIGTLRDTIPAEDPTNAPNGGVIVYGPRDGPDESPVNAPGGGVIVYGPRDDIPAEDPTKSSGGGVIVYGPREAIPA
ncbi:hypothetical protein B0H13DRAFT_2307512 [Mycena leptocephala]|nr:hypothetical protein B0H13DRAFT_2307512 [Mycena leptocephala]